MFYTGILCGNFTTNGLLLDPMAIDARWQHLTKSSEERAMGHRFYYPQFYNLCYGSQSDNIGGMERYRMVIDKEITLNFGTSSHQITINNLELTLCPMDIALFNITITISTECAEDISLIMSRLRGITNYIFDPESLRPFSEIALVPFITILNYINSSTRANNEGCHLDELVRFGNKFKLFQILELSSEEYNARAASEIITIDDIASTKNDILLFELGTLYSLNDNSFDSPNSPSKRYYKEIIEGNLISVFNNWQALALFDTFTFLGKELDAEIRNNWIDNYFGMIYLYNLFVKTYLLQLNNNYEMDSRDGRIHQVSTLNESYNHFEARYYNPDISYNFLPRLIHKHIDSALDIEAEKNRIFERIERQSMLREKRADTKMNQLLMVMTCLTMFSAIWDACCLLNELYPFSDYWATPIWGFRTISSLILSMLLIFFLVIYRHKK